MATLSNAPAPAQEDNEQLSSLLDFALVAEEFLLNHERQFRLRGNDVGYWICGLPNPFYFPNLRDDRQKPPASLFAILKGICNKAYAVERGRFVKARDFSHDRDGWWVKVNLAEIQKWARCTYEQWRSAKPRLVVKKLLKIKHRSIPVPRGRYEGSVIFLQVNFGTISELLRNIDNWKRQFPEVPVSSMVSQPDRVGVNPNPNINIMGRAVDALPFSSSAPVTPSLCQTDTEMARTRRKKENGRERDLDFFKDKRQQEGNSELDAESTEKIRPDRDYPNDPSLIPGKETGAWENSKALWSTPGDTDDISPERLLTMLSNEYTGNVAIETAAGQLATAVESPKVISALNQLLDILADKARAAMAPLVNQTDVDNLQVFGPETKNVQEQSIKEKVPRDTTPNASTDIPVGNGQMQDTRGQTADESVTSSDGNRHHTPGGKDLADLIREEDKRVDREAGNSSDKENDKAWQFADDIEGREIVYLLESDENESVTRSMARRIQQLRFNLPARLCMTPDRVREFLENRSIGLLDQKAAWLAKLKLPQLLTKPAWITAAKYLLRFEHRDAHIDGCHTMLQILSLEAKAEKLLEEIYQPGFLDNGRRARWKFANTEFMQEEAKLEQFLYAWCHHWPEESLAPLRQQAKEVIMNPDWAFHFHYTDPILHWAEGLGLTQAEVDKIESQAKTDISQYRRYVKRALLKGDFDDDEAANIEKLLQRL
jgi:hypothetical protein